MKILVVDDEKDMQLLFEQRFRKEIREGITEFAFAFSGEQALQYLQQLNHEAVLILSDINMPGMSGFELLKQIKQQYSSPPPVVIMITAYSDAENYNQAIQLGADGFITKPIDFIQLKEKLKINVDGQDISSR
jgi:CheY-like chemotaxis protein